MASRFRRRIAWMAGSLLGSTALATPAWAQDGTWSANPTVCPGVTRCDYNAPGNWGPAGVPTGTATFGATNISDIEFVNPVGSPPIVIGRFLFTAAAPAYTFRLQSDELTFTGEGIINNSSATQRFIVGNRSDLRFTNSSSAGNAHMLAEGSQGRISFENNSNAGTAQITIGGSGFGRLEFRDNSSAANATISNPFGNIIFSGNSTAGNARITNLNGTIFSGASSLGSAQITNRSGLRIFADASGAGATIVNETGGVVDISQVAGGATNVSIGSLSGAGAIQLGGRTLTVGALNRDETISGAISDGGDLGGTGGSLTKTGAGTLTLSGASTYTGATTVNGGALLLTGSINGASGTMIGAVTGSNGRLTIQGGGALTSTGAAVIGAFGGTGNVLVTGAGSRWTIGGGLSIGIASTGGASGGIGRLMIENGATVTSNGALLSGNRQDGSDDGRVTVSGAGSVWNSGALSMFSARTPALLTIAAGGAVNSTNAGIAAAMLVTGPGSVWNSGALIIGPNVGANGAPRGDLRIADGAVVNSSSVIANDDKGGFPSVVLVEGAGSIWNMTGDLVAARQAIDGAFITIRNGGRVNVANGAGAVLLGTAGGLASLTIGGGAPGATAGTLNATSVQTGANAILSFEYAGNTSVFAPVITGTGQIFAGSGMTVLTGDSSAFAGRTTIFAGATLQLGNGGGSGALGGNIVNNSALIVNRTGALTLAGIISGTGTFAHNGGATTTLSGTNTYTGATTVNGGTLLITGAIASAVTVNNGATLGGTGTVGATSIASGGTLAAGLSVGTLNVAGNLTFAAGGNFLVEVAPAAADRVTVGGAATLAGTLTALGLGGTFTAREYTVLNAAGGLTGTFNTLVTQGSFGSLRPSLRYEGNSVFLVLAVGGGGGTFTTTTSETDSIIFNAPTITVQRVGLFETRIIGRLTGGTPLFDQTVNAAFGSAPVQTALAAARLAITAGGGPGVVVISDPVLVSRTVSSATSTASVFTLAGTSQTVTTATTFGPATITIGDRRSCGGVTTALPSSTRPICGTPGGTSFTVAAGATNVNTNTQTDYTVSEARTDTITETMRETYELTGTVVPVGTVHAAVQSALFDLGGRFLARMGEESAPARFGERGDTAGTGSALAPAGGGRAWAEFYGYRARADARGGIFAERRDARGLAGGFSLAAGEGLTVGLAVDRGRLDLAVPGSGEEADVDMTQLAASARLGAGPFSLGLAFAYGFGNVDSRRALGGIATSARYDVDLIGGAAEARYTFETGGLRLTPVAALDWARVSSDAFIETGAFGLAAPDASRSRTRAAIGLEAGTSILFEGGARLDLAASGRYLAVLSGAARALPVAFNAAPGNALVMRGLAERDAVALGGQAAFHLTPSLSLYVAYDGRFAGGYDGHAAVAGIRIGW